GKIIKTINGGSNWILQNSNTNLHLNAVKFYNEQTGWAVGGWTNMSYAYAIIVNTVNGGNTWNIQPNPDSYTNIIYDISIFDANNVIIASGGTSFQGFSLGGFISKTTNGGINWFTILGNYNYGPDAFTSLSFINSSTGWAGVLNQSDVGPGILKIYKTTNMGNNWGVLDSNTVQTNVNPTNTLQKVQFINNTTGYIYGKYYLKKTTSGGANWTKLDSATTTNGNDYYFVNKDTGWIVKPTGIIRTNNGGANWALQNSPLTGLRKIFFINSLTGWAVGNNGGIVKTVSGGYLLPSDTESAKYFPMHIGNLYTYYWYEIGPYGSSGYFKARITKDTIMNGYRYYYLNNFPDIGTGWVRYDSSRSNLLAYYPNANCSGYINDKIIDSLKMSINDQITTCVYHWTWLLCQDTTSISIFNNTVSSKGFRHDGLMLAYTRYAKNFGIISYNYGEPPPSTYFSLIRGCKINEIVYGDTNIYYTVSGNARYSDNNQPVTSGTIKAFKLDKNTANIIVFDTAVIQSNGSYTLPNVPQDSVDIGVFPNSTPPNDYVITYYPSTIYWEHATTLYPTGNLTNINIGAIRMSSSTNSNSVNGKVMRLNDNPLGNLKDAVLYAKNGNTFVRCAVSDGNGIYHLQSLPT
ncbi:MAG: hypothetical protein NTU73_10035, partial [Ignavibacteriae bacterium]|nr:hypothetical protein [Ignavibacteriota bacterium]